MIAFSTYSLHSWTNGSDNRRGRIEATERATRPRTDLNKSMSEFLHPFEQESIQTGIHIVRTIQVEEVVRDLSTNALWYCVIWMSFLCGCHDLVCWQWVCWAWFHEILPIQKMAGQKENKHLSVCVWLSGFKGLGCFDESVRRKKPVKVSVFFLRISRYLITKRLKMESWWSSYHTQRRHGKGWGGGRLEDKKVKYLVGLFSFSFRSRYVTSI